MSHGRKQTAVPICMQSNSACCSETPFSSLPVISIQLSSHQFQSFFFTTSSSSSFQVSKLHYSKKYMGSCKQATEEIHLPLSTPDSQRRKKREMSLKQTEEMETKAKSHSPSALKIINQTKQNIRMTASPLRRRLHNTGSIPNFQ